MARGRALAAEGVKTADREDVRHKEIAAGTLKMAKEPRSLCVITGTAFDAAAGKVTEAYTRWVVYTPFATPESTGLSLTPVPGGPWLMYPGKGDRPHHDQPAAAAEAVADPAGCRCRTDAGRRTL